jgi:hypothetical protein
VQLELDDDLFPARRSLVGLQFADEREFDRARALATAEPGAYNELYPVWRMIVVRRDDAARFAAANFHFLEIEQLDDEDLPPEEVARRDRALIDSWKPILFARAGQPR